MPTEVKEKGDRGFMLSLDGGKYVIFYNWSKEGQFKCQRYGENWREFVGDKMMMSLCRFALSKPAQKPIDDQLNEMFEYHMSEVQEEYPNLTHGAVTMTAAERAVEILQERLHKIADDRKWGHIEEVNKSHFGG